MRWNLWLQWLLINIFGFAIATVVSMSLTQVTFGAVFLAGAIVGAIVGTAQESILGSKLSNWGGQWIVLTTVGGGIGWLAGAMGSASVSSVLPLPEAGRVGAYATLTGACIGMIVGLFQVIALRQKSAKAGWWIPASILGRAAGWLVGFLIVSLNIYPLGFAEPDWTNFVFVGASGGSVYGSITGFALIWLLRNPQNA